MTFQDILNYLKDNKDALGIIGSTFLGIITVVTFVRAFLEYRLQGSQKRADLYNKFDNVFDEEKIKMVVELLENNVDGSHDAAISKIPLIDKEYFLGFYEQIYMAVNSNLLNRKIVHYMFGKFALLCWNTPSFWDKRLDKNSSDWFVFRSFIEEMQRVKEKNYRKDFRH